MSDGYWQHSLGVSDGHVSGWRALTRDGQDAADVDSRAKAHEPVAREAREAWEASGPYWRGNYREQGPQLRKEQPGAVSARARRAYAAEALRQKDHVTAGLLAIFLGVFGVHKFYLGCNQAGFIMLAVSVIGGILTFGLAIAVIEVIAIIEGVVYLTKSQTEFDRIYVLHQRDWF